MSIAEKFKVIADEVYKKGISNAELEFWKGFTLNGTKQNYYYAFMSTDFTDKTIPEGLCKPRVRLGCMFYQYLGKKLPLGIDCSEFKNTNASMHASQMFRYSSLLTEIYDIGLPVQKTYEYAFEGCNSLTKISVIRSDENTLWNGTFNTCSNLVELEIEGKIGKNGFNVSSCLNLTHDSLMSIINATATITSAQTLTLGTANLNKLANAEKAIALNRGWTLA